MCRVLALFLVALLLAVVPAPAPLGEAVAEKGAPSRPPAAPARKPAAPTPKAPPPAAPRAGSAGPVVNSYQQCLALVEQDPALAAKSAEAWFAGAGGAAARHCAALAHSAQGEHAAAGVILESLARDEPGIPNRTRAELYGQAAASWLLLQEAGRSEAVMNSALALAPGDPEFLLQRAEARAAAGRDWEALDDLNQAIDSAPDEPLVLVFRAAVLRQVGSLDLAGDDLARALTLDPESPDAFLERGYLRQAQGDLAGAFRDWLAVLRFSPEGGVAEIARRNLRELEGPAVPQPKN
ncbi:MAG: hypothetical protein EXQ96_07465 [Alphaproteobacteria bacterium]|nr:hypothetical protein [Alphaproteobacteria bacterium]